ncbi:hypothetical protein [Sporolactobacillus terrae]|uniref:Uncharacterized protein n=1 Tax=Sporolactobacillus terrae TaxID=269673 RepID=A0A5K7WT08_9BACL|nr:hypothetical protein [Sporolactobacillus terrae]BBN97477.1 hypothetical protein St703_01820 [Sporolactobacillus terrae]
MSEDYVLKTEVDNMTLYELNIHFGDGKYKVANIHHAIEKWLEDNLGNGYPSLEQLEDWIAALKSGKKIVNPLSPREKVKWLFDYVAKDKTAELYHKQYVLDTLQEFIIQIAKEHPDVKDWLKDGESDADA